MAKTLFFLLFICIAFDTSAFQSDTSAYQTQRLRINALLSERSAKFGQYEQSLTARTGIFGFQTKKDIRNSNEILRQIVLNDNNIFRELKTLMEYKDLEVATVKTDADEVNNRVENYRKAIKTLQDQNEQLRKEVKSINSGKSFSNLIIVLLVLSLGAMGWFYRKKQKQYTNEKAVF